MTKPTAAFAMEAGLQHRLFTAEVLSALRGLVSIDPDLVLEDFTCQRSVAALARTEVLITGWASPQIDAAALARAPELRVIIHAAGTIRNHVTPACWERGIAVTSAASANALPVAEFTLASIIMAGKNARAYERLYHARRGQIRLLDEIPAAGNYHRAIGIVGASRIGRRLIELIRPLDFAVSVHDPYLTAAQAAELNVTLVSLPELLMGSDVVTLHAPALPSTRHMIDRTELAMMRDGATLINTARGSLVNQDALVEELAKGRINAVIDVTEPEVLPEDSPLYTLKNVILTPHIAGSLGGELHRFGMSALAEVRRYVAGVPLSHAISLSDLERIA